MSKPLSSIQKITLTSMLLVLDVLFTHFLRTPTIGSLPFLRISLGPSIVIFSSLLLGPFYGAIVGGAGDLIGIFIFSGLEGQINPLITIVYALLGVLPWCLMRVFSRFRESLKKPYFLVAVMGLMLILLVCLFYAIPSTSEYFKNGFGEISIWMEPLILSLTAFFFLVAGFGLFFMNRHFEKNSELASLPSPYEMAMICLISEVILMVGLLPLAFYLFYNFMADEIWPISYGTLFSCMFVFTGIKVVINTFVVYWLLVVTKKYLVKGE